MISLCSSLYNVDVLGFIYSRSPKVENPIASILKSHLWGIPALSVLNPVSNFLGVTICLLKGRNPEPSDLNTKPYKP